MTCEPQQAGRCWQAGAGSLTAPVSAMAGLVAGAGVLLWPRGGDGSLGSREPAPASASGLRGASRRLLSFAQAAVPTAPPASHKVLMAGLITTCSTCQGGAAAASRPAPTGCCRCGASLRGRRPAAAPAPPASHASAAAAPSPCSACAARLPSRRGAGGNMHHMITIPMCKETVHRDDA